MLEAASGLEAATLEHGLALHDAGQLDEAAAAFAGAAQRHPESIDHVLALGHCLLDAKRSEEALHLLATARQGHAGDIRLLILQGRAHLAAGAVDAAIGALSLALAVAPDDPAAHTGFANALAAHGEMERALRHSMLAFHMAGDPDHASNFAGMLIAAGHFEEAATVAGFALRHRPGHFGALLNRATALDGQGRLQAAIEATRLAIAARPADIAARLMLAGLCLRLGQMTAEAWDLYECRHRLSAGTPGWMAGPVWSGEPAAGRTILLHAEQGYGDTLHFVRYAPLVAERAGRVVLVVQPALLRLLRGTPGVDQIVAMGDGLPPFDLVCPLLSLPRVFGTNLASIPPPLPYALSLPPPDDAPAVLRVGLVWAGNPGFPLDALRSIAAASLAVLAGIPGVQFYSLQHPSAALPEDLCAIDLMGGVADFADTATRIAGLDLVIAVDTAVAHLAATMGKPVWLLSRFRGCWRWLHDRADSPWYPSMRIMRQTRPRDWSGVLAQIRRDLVAIAASGHQA